MNSDPTTLNGTVRGKSACPVGRSPYPLVNGPTAIFRYFKTSPEIIRIAVMMHVRFPLSLRNVEELLQSESLGRSLCCAKAAPKPISSGSK